jgi:glycosyltransferase involved in cell wall biosynthesis
MSEREPREPRLSVVIPTFNKEARIAATLEAVVSYLAGKPFASEIVIVDDGSTDLTADVAKAALAGRIPSKVISRGFNLGKGASVREGVLAAAGEIVLFADDDLSTPIAELDRTLAALEAGADVVIGSRAHPDSAITVRQRRPRELMGKAFNLLVRLFVLRGYRDTQCGFKAFRRRAARAVFSRLRTAGFGFDVEVLVLCRELGFRVAEVPVTWCDIRPSRLRFFRGSWGMLKDLWRIRRDVRRGRKGRGTVEEGP